MAEDAEQFFDLSMKKKKKKKKAPFLGEEDIEAVEEVKEPKEEKPEVPAEAEAVAKDVASDLDDEDFTFSMKKKKKKTRKVNFDDDNTFALDDGGEAKDDAMFGMDGEKDEATASLDGELDDLALTKKKKKKKRDLVYQDEDEGLAGEEADDNQGGTWMDNDRDYHYEELLSRVFEIMRQRNPDMVAGEKRRMCLRPPQVVRIGTRRTAFVNFTEICKMIHRQPEHLMAFTLAELGTSGAVDGQNQLIVKGRFQPKQIENILRRYIREYVTCHTCRSPETILTKENRLFFLQCETCGAHCSVAAIQSGYQAVTSRRARLRQG